MVAGSQRRPLWTALSRVHVIAAAAWLGVLAAELSTIAAQLRANPTVAAPSLLGSALAGGTLGRPIESAQPGYLWLFAATAPLGHPQVLLTLLPLAIAWLGVLGAAVAVARVGGRWAGSLALALGLGAGPLVLLSEAAAAFHGIVWAATGLIGLLVVGAARHPARGIWLALFLVGGAAAGVVVATDPLLMLTGLVPLALAALWLRAGPQRAGGPLVAAAAILAGAAAGAMATTGLMAAGGYRGGVLDAGAGLAGSLGAGAPTLGNGLLDLANGLPTSGAVQPAEVGAAVAVLGLVLAAVIAVAWRALWAAPPGDRPAGAVQRVRRRPAGLTGWIPVDRSAAGLEDGPSSIVSANSPNSADVTPAAAEPGAVPAPATETAAPVAREAHEGVQLRAGAATAAHVVYWSSSAALLVLAVLVSNVGSGAANPSAAARLVSPERLLTGVFLSAVALVPLWPRRPRVRALAAVLAALFIASSCVRVAAATIDDNFQPENSRTLPALQERLLTGGVQRGYAPSAVALPLRLAANGSLDILPAAEGAACGVADPATLCRDLGNTQGGWFTAAAGPSFVVVDPSDPALATAPASLGPPLRSYTVDRFTVYIYSGDAMRSFASSCAGRADHRCTS